MKKVSVLVVALAFFWTSGASATSLVTNHTQLGSMSSVNQCIALGERSMTGLGMSLLSATSAAAWGEWASTDELCAVYCIMDYGLAVVSCAGNDLDSLDFTVTDILNQFETGVRAGKF